ncbi:MAG: adenylate/guanylate cyclase domain-containing protein [Actinomycetota bacterium]
MRDLIGIRKVSEHALRHLADMFADDTNPIDPTDVPVDATIVFADIEGFSDVVAREGDDAAAAVLDQLDAAVEAAVGPTAARVVKRLGDGVMIAADDPADGVLVAAALPAAFACRLADTTHPLRLRVGAHRGVVRSRGDDLIGYHVNVAARVAEQASGGEALVTGALHDSVELSHPLRAVEDGQLVAKGVPERPRVFRLVVDAEQSPCEQPLTA